MSQANHRLGPSSRTSIAQAEAYVRDQVWISAAIAFGMGVGTGLAIVSLLADGQPTHRTALAERLGTQLLGAVRDHIPSSWMSS